MLDKPKYIPIEENSDHKKVPKEESSLGQMRSKRNAQRQCICNNQQPHCVGPDEDCKKHKNNIICNPDNCQLGDAGSGNRIGETYLTSCYPKKSQNKNWALI